MNNNILTYGRSIPIDIPQNDFLNIQQNEIAPKLPKLKQYKPGERLEKQAKKEIKKITTNIDYAAEYLDKLNL